MQDYQPRWVYVLDKDGKPLMPTQRYGRVRRLLKDGRAVIKDHTPFIIQLTYEPETKILQPIKLGKDPGRTNLGLAAVREDGTCVYLSHTETRNKKIPKLMRKRHRCRRASRQGRRLVLKRRAKKAGTEIHNEKKEITRILPMCKKPITCKNIINKEARFANRKREPGWLTPTATQLLRTHLNSVMRVTEFLPITDIAMEVNRFAFMALEDPTIWKHKKDFQNGPLKGHNGIHDAVYAMQKGKCLLCGRKDIDIYHHMLPLSKGGADTIDNTVGLCEGCHEEFHKDPDAAKKLKERHGQRNKKYGAASALNQIIPTLARELDAMFPDHVQIVSPLATKETRTACKLDKTHANDAYCIAFSTLENADTSKASTVNFKPYEITQQRRHDRAKIHSQRERKYKLDGKTVATNRHKRMGQADDADEKEAKGQTTDSLEEWRNKQYETFYKEAIADGFISEDAEKIAAKKTRQIISKLKVVKSKRIYNPDPKGRTFFPGDAVLHSGKRCVVSGQKNKGKYLQFVGFGDLYFPAKDCKLIQRNRGLVYL